jgi:hypothetical protein
MVQETAASAISKCTASYGGTPLPSNTITLSLDYFTASQPQFRRFLYYLVSKSLRHKLYFICDTNACYFAQDPVHVPIMLKPYSS